jgi:hypothetical protein
MKTNKEMECIFMSEDQLKSKVQEQFAKNAKKYVESPIHAKGLDLNTMIEWLKPPKDWTVLDIATGGGHVSKKLSPLVNHVLAIDNPQVLAGMAKRSMKKKKDDLERALFGSVGLHQKMMLKTQLSHIDFLDQQIKMLSEEVQQRMQPYEEDIELIDSIPGIGRSHAEQLLAEIGLGKEIAKQFPTAAHLCSWAGMVPGNNESAGKKKSGKTRKGKKSCERHLLKQHIQRQKPKTLISLLNINAW